MRPPIRLVETDDRPALKLVGEDDTPLNLRDTESFDIPEATPEELSNLKEPINITAERSTTDVGKPLMQDVVEINPVKAAHSQKQIDLLIPKIQEIMEKGVMGNPDYFKDEKNRERFFNNLSSRYTEEEISQLKGEKRIPALDKFTEERQAEMEQGDGYMQQRKPLTPLGESEGFARIMSSPADAFTHGIIGGWDKLKETGNVYDKEGDIAATGNAVAAVTHMVMGGLNLLPAMAAFTVSATVAGEIAPETTEAILAPITAITDPQTEGGKSWAQIGDFLAFAGVLGGAVKGKAVLKGKGSEAGTAGAEGIAEGLKDFSKLPIEEQKTKIEEYAQDIVKENKFESNLTPVEKQVFTFSKQAQDLMKEIENAPNELKPIYEAKLAEVDTKHTEAADQAATQNIADAANKTVSDNLQEAKTILENHVPTTETGRALKEEHLSKLNEAINELNPKKDEVKTEEKSTEKADAEKEVLTENVPEETKVSGEAEKVTPEPLPKEGFTEATVINEGYRNLKEKIGEKKAKKYFEQVDKLIDPNKNEIVEYRENGVITKEGDKYLFHPLMDVDLKTWRLSENRPNDITEQFIGEKVSEGNKIAQDNGFKEATHLRNAVAKATGEKPATVQEVTLGQLESVKNGKEISPNKEVSASKAVAIKELASKHGLKEMEATMLHALKNKDVQAEWSDAKGLKEQMYFELDKKGFLEVSEMAGDKVISEKGQIFIDAVDARYETRKAVKAGTDLFPEEANIPELTRDKPAETPPVKEATPSPTTEASKPPKEDNVGQKELTKDENFNKINEIVSEYGWSVKEKNKDGYYQLTNRGAHHAANIYVAKSGRYEFYNRSGSKVGSDAILERGIRDLIEKQFLTSKESKVDKSVVQEALSNRKYQAAILEKRMTAQDAATIIESAGLEVPKEISDLINKSVEPLKTETDATKEKPIKESISPKPESGDQGGKETVTSSSDSVLGTEKIKKEKVSEKKPQPIKVGDDVRFTAMGTDRTGTVKGIKEDGRIEIESTTSWEKGFKHTVKPEDILKEGETSKSRFDKKVDEVAEKIKEKVKPKGLKGIKVSKAGFGFDEVVDAAAVIVKKAHKVKGDVEVAIKKAIAFIEKNWDETWGEFKESDFDSIFREGLNVTPASTTKAKESKISNLSPEVSASMLRKSTILTEKTLQAKARRTWDKFYKGYVKHIEDISGNAKEALRNAGGQEAVMLKDIANKSSGKASLKINQFDKEIFKGLDKNQMRSLGEIIEAKRAIQLDEIYDARRVDRLKHESGFTSEFYKNALDDMKAKDKDGFADIEKRADDYFKAQQELLDLKKENGMIGQEGYDKLLEQSLYSPRIYIQHLNEAGAAINGGKKISVGSGDIKRLDEGSEGLIVKDPRLLLATSISKVYAITEKNNAAKSLLKFAQENLDNGVVRERKIVGETKTGTPILEDVPSGHDIVSAMVDGQKKDMIVSKEFASEWVSTDPAISVAFGEAMQWLTGSAALRMAATGYNPLFALANAPRDMAYIYFTTDVYSPHLPVMAKQIHQDMFNVAADVFARKGRYKEFINEGGSIEYLTHQGRFYTGKAANEGVNKALRVLSYVGETSELLTRVALRERGIQNRTEKFIKANDKPPNAEELKKIKIESTYDAINQLDFSQGGDWAKAVNKFVPYVNAAFQASRGLARAARRNPKQFAYKAGQLVALAGGLAAYNLTQEGFDEVDADEKSRNYIIMLGGMYRIDEKGNKRYKYLKIPKTQDAYFISSMAEQTVEFIQNGKKPDKQSWLAAKGQMPPIPFITTNPPIMEGIRTYQSNYDAYFDKKLWYGSLDAPNELQFYKNTPEAYKIIGDATGLSPIKLRGGISKVVPNIEKNPFLAIPIKAFAIAAEAMGVKEKTNLDKSFGKNMEDALGGLYKKYIGETYVQEKSTKKFTGSTPDPEELKLTPEEKRQMKEDAEEAKKLLREEKNYVE